MNATRGSSTSLSLLVRAKDKDNLAWDRIVELYGPLMYRFCRLHNLQSEDARDICQDAFRSAFVDIHRFRRDRPGDSFRKWLLTIAKNKIRDYHRARNKNPQAVGGSNMQATLQQIPEVELDESASDSNVAQRAIKLIQVHFRDQTWKAFWETTVEGRDPLDVAQEMGISKWSVYQARSRVIRRVREEYDGLLEKLV